MEEKKSVIIDGEKYIYINGEKFKYSAFKKMVAKIKNIPDEKLQKVLDVYSDDMREKIKTGQYPVKKPFDRSFWIVPGKLLAGCYPGDSDDKIAENKIMSLYDSGIRTIINLMEPDETDHYGNVFNEYNKIIDKLELNINVYRHSIVDGIVPTVEEMYNILDKIDEEIGADRGVYVHCWGGRGRTGTVVGCYLIRTGMATHENFIDVISELRRDVPDADLLVPENDEQVRFVQGLRV